MTIIYPVDILADFPGWTTKFEPLFRQEQSRTAAGVTYVKDFGSPLWSAAYQSRELSINELDHWRARLEAMEGGVRFFRGYSLSRCRPIAYPAPAEAPESGVTLSGIGADNRSVSLAGAPSGFLLSVGDMVEIEDSGLYRVAEQAVAGASATPLFEVRPHLWPGTATGSAVSLIRPSCTMMVVPGSIMSDADASTGRGVVSFQGIEVR